MAKRPAPKPHRQPPIKQKDGWLYWDFDVRAVRERRDSGMFTVTVALRRSRRVRVEQNLHPFTALARIMLRLAKEDGQL